MLAPILQAALLGVFVTRTAVSASEASGLFDNSAYGHAQWKRYCSDSIAKPDELPPHACFTLHDDITMAAHSSTHNTLGFAAASGQDFVVTAPKEGEDGKIEFFASGFWLRIAFSDNTKCARIEVWAPTRDPGRKRKDGEEPALEPFSHGSSCSGAEQKIFVL